MCSHLPWRPQYRPRGGRGRQGEGPLSSSSSRGKALERFPAHPLPWGPANSDPVISPDLRGDQAG